MNDKLIKKVIDEWNERITPPSFESFTRKKRNHRWLNASLTAAAIILIVLVALELFQPSDVDDMFFATDFLLTDKF